MSLFKYQAKDQKGQPIAGTMDVENRAMALARLQGMGYFPIKVDEVKEKSQGKGIRGMLGRRIKSPDICEFYRQMADLISAGITLVKALQIVATQTPNPSLQQIISTVAADVQGGSTFGQALEKHSKIFPKLAVALIHSGERGGFLAEVLQQLAAIAELEEELKGKIRSALAYPLVMVFVGTAVVIFLMSFVMPKITSIYTEMHQTLPAITQVMILLSDFMGQRWYLAVMALALAAMLYWRFAKSKDGRRMTHRFILKVPILGEVILKREISRFARTFGQMLKNGVPILQALEIVKDVASNDIIREAIEQAPADITQGANVAGTLKKSKVFPPGVINMIAIGEETGRLPDVLLQIAPSYESQADRMVKTMTAMIEPLIILAMGVVVGFIVIAMLLPILTINPTAQ